MRKSICRTVCRARIPEPLKYFLFGVSRKRRHLRNDIANEVETAPDYLEESGIAKAIDQWAAIETNLLKPFTMKTIAAGLGVDASEIKDYFSNVSTEGFNKWRNRVRVRLAAELILRNNGESLESIGRKVGFTDKSNFYKQFRLYKGKTPGEWRSTGGRQVIVNE
ncbi:MAG: helix-turn-helix domain-containing protein [Candidatus Cryptobacteroides sp.]|nr:helix-turn-helix domain-containing protein [Candidatus Cryptobacteroides sp.]